MYKMGTRSSSKVKGGTSLTKPTSRTTITARKSISPVQKPKLITTTKRQKGARSGAVPKTIQKSIESIPLLPDSSRLERPPVTFPNRSPQLPYTDQIVRPSIQIAAKEMSFNDQQMVERFFQCGPGQYSEGDMFLGIKSQPLHRLVKESLDSFVTLNPGKTVQDIPLEDLVDLMNDRYNDIRSIGYESLVKIYQHKQTTDKQKKAIVKCYLDNCKGTRNWNVVDISSYPIIGKYLIDNEKERNILMKLTKSKDFWEQRVSIVSTLSMVKVGLFDEIFQMARYHLFPLKTISGKPASQLSDTDPLDMTTARASLYANPHNHLLHKAIGWMLREAAKKDQQRVNDFLAQDNFFLLLPTHTYSYSLERHLPDERSQFIRKKRGNVFIKPIDM
jgi:3-methyladenine DNA glycosylase AlkD